MFEAMRQAAFLHKLTPGDPRALPAKTALAMATIDGARTLGLDQQIGSLAPGKRADLILVDTRRLSYAGASSDLLAALVRALDGNLVRRLRLPLQHVEVLQGTSGVEEDDGVNNCRRSVRRAERRDANQ